MAAPTQLVMAKAQPDMTYHVRGEDVRGKSRFTGDTNKKPIVTEGFALKARPAVYAFSVTLGGSGDRAYLGVAAAAAGKPFAFMSPSAMKHSACTVLDTGDRTLYQAGAKVEGGRVLGPANLPVMKAPAPPSRPRFTPPRLALFGCWREIYIAHASAKPRRNWPSAMSLMGKTGQPALPGTCVGFQGPGTRRRLSPSALLHTRCVHPASPHPPTHAHTRARAQLGEYTFYFVGTSLLALAPASAGTGNRLVLVSSSLPPRGSGTLFHAVAATTNRAHTVEFGTLRRMDEVRACVPTPCSACPHTTT